jgi:hypothetical protein
MKKKIKVSIEEKEFKDCFYPISVKSSVSVKVKAGKETETFTRKVASEDNLNKKELKKFMKKFDPSKVKIKTSLSNSYQTEVTLDVCEVCSIGTGKTHYPDGWHEHIEKKLYKLHGYDVCSACYKKYKNFSKRRFNRKLRKLQEEND